MPSLLITPSPWNTDNQPPSKSCTYEWVVGPTRHSGATSINSLMDSLGVDAPSRHGEALRVIVDVDDELAAEMVELDEWFENPDPSEAYHKLDDLHTMLRRIMAAKGV